MTTLLPGIALAVPRVGSAPQRPGARALLERFAREDCGQDIIEYALLAGLIAVVGIATWQGIQTGIGTKYSGWDTGVQDLSACTPDPIDFGGGGCP